MTPEQKEDLNRLKCLGSDKEFVFTCQDRSELEALTALEACEAERDKLRALLKEALAEWEVDEQFLGDENETQIKRIREIRKEAGIEQ